MLFANKFQLKYPLASHCIFTPTLLSSCDFCFEYLSFPLFFMSWWLSSADDEFTVRVGDGKTIREFNFDRVFLDTSTQSDVYEDTGNLIQSAVDGFNVCIFAYGQTGRQSWGGREGHWVIRIWFFLFTQLKLGFVYAARKRNYYW